MAVLGYAEIVLGLLCFLFLRHYWKHNKNSPPIINWPVVGMLPGLLQNATHMYDCTTRALKLYGGTVEVKGPWCIGMDFFFTSDPLNAQYILSKNFGNYEKGPEIREILQPALGDGIINSDSDWWTFQRKMIHSIMKNNKFELFSLKVVQQKVVNRLIPVLNHVSISKIEVDLQDIFKRFTFDNTCSMVLGFDPKSLSVEFPKLTYEKAFDVIEEGLVYRQILPQWCWKGQRWLQIGQEKKLRKACDIFDSFLNQRIASKREELSRDRTQLEEAEFDLLTACMMHEDIVNMGVCSKSNKFIRDAAFNLMTAGTDTMTAALTWFFWQIATHPSVEMKIMKEMTENLTVKVDKKWECFGVQELDTLVYLHAALCEALRLYPSVAFNPRTSVREDILPSGHRIRPNTPIMVSLYAMGRMEEIWGEDCMQYKPERWISEKGGLIFVPSYKFTAFSGGPRSCLGKALAFIQLKTLATSIIWNYHVEMVAGHSVYPSVSAILNMKHGLKVRITKRST